MIKHRGQKQQRDMRLIALVIVALLIPIGALSYSHRVAIKHTIAQWTAPPLPAEEAYPQTPIVTSTEDEVMPVPPAPLATPGTIPPEKRLAVPFMSQAPHANWDMPYQEACEEASALMAVGYYQGDRGKYNPDVADKKILDLVAFQEKEYGFYKDTSAAETKRFMEALFPDLTVQIVPLKDAEQIKQYIADGYPVIVPADGKTLPNPNFQNGGPLFHMLVIRGYTETQFITNDPGTRLGENFLYEYEGLLNAIHDWNNGDVPNGEKVILVVKPRD